MNNVSPALATVPFVQYAATSGVAIATWSPRAAFLLLVLLFADLFNPVLKKISSATLPSALIDRPDGCGSRSGQMVSCNIFPKFGTKSPTTGTGFPSGHAQSVGVMAGYVTRSLIKQRGISIWKRAVGIAAAWGTALAVATQRVYVRCHTVPQVITGMVIGSAIGWFGNTIADEVFKSRS